jgi:hypothetical protein
MITVTFDSLELGAAIFLILFFLAIMYRFASEGGFSQGRQEGFESGLKVGRAENEDK